jgi:mercuric ion transport protein
MDNNRLILTGVTGAAITAFCSTCGAPLLATVLAALGLSAWLGSIDYMLLAIMGLFLGLAGYGLYRQRGKGTEPAPENVLIRGMYPSPYRSTGQASRNEERGEGTGMYPSLRSEERGEGVRNVPASRNEESASASAA